MAPWNGPNDRRNMVKIGPVNLEILVSGETVRNREKTNSGTPWQAKKPKQNPAIEVSEKVIIIISEVMEQLDTRHLLICRSEIVRGCVSIRAHGNVGGVKRLWKALIRLIRHGPALVLSLIHI